MIVADANAVAALVLPGDESGVADQLQRAEPAWVAPPLIISELRSVVAKLVRTGRQTPVHGVVILELALEALEAVTFEPDPRRVFELVAASGCSSYDCEYVAIAEELRCPLATFDREVLRAFPGIAEHPKALVDRLA